MDQYLYWVEHLNLNDFLIHKMCEIKNSPQLVDEFLEISSKQSKEIISTFFISILRCYENFHAHIVLFCEIVKESLKTFPMKCEIFENFIKFLKQLNDTGNESKKYLSDFINILISEIIVFFIIIHF
jgi:GTP1/Obg family GTP-binding protein